MISVSLYVYDFVLTIFFWYICVLLHLCFCTLCFAALPPLVIVLTGKAAPVGLVICVILTKFSPNQGKRPDN